MGWDRRRIGWLLAVTSVVSAFAMGWLLGRGDGARTPTTPPAASSSASDGGLRPEDVELRLDAGGLTLMPEGGLELAPIEPLGGAAASGGSSSAQSP